VSEELYCPHCGTRNPAGANFCNRCGAALAEAEPASADPAAPLASQDSTEELVEAEQDVEEFEAFEDALLEEMAPPTSRVASADESESEGIVFPDEQVLGRGQGYLELAAIASDLGGAELSDATHKGRPGDAEHWRTIRSLMRDETILATSGVAAGPKAGPYRLAWVTLVILLAALAAVMVASDTPFGEPQEWNGVAEAFDAINSLQVDDDVLVLWDYDPASSGEMDAVALPVVSNLLERKARSVVVTRLPAGLASARRLYDQAVIGLDEGAMEAVLEGWVGEGMFVAGGSAALPLIADDSAAIVSFEASAPPEPVLALVVAANVVDVQQWLEIAQPMNGLRVVAVTSAAADVMLLPYLESGQLNGLVSGFDGAWSYQQRRSEALGSAATFRLDTLVRAQDWGALAILLIMIVGNVVTLFWKGRRG
jgi:hypothetical protein